MRRTLILVTLTLLLMAVAGITVAQEEGFGPERRFQTEPAAQEATIREPTKFVDESSAESNGSTTRDVIENSDSSDTDNTEDTEDKLASAASKGENGDKSEHVGKVAGKGKPVSKGRPEEFGKPEGGERAEGNGNLTSKEEKARRPYGATKPKDDGEKTHGGPGQQKITLCHKGRHTITVGAPARAAHLRHGDSRGECRL